MDLNFKQEFDEILQMLNESKSADKILIRLQKRKSLNLREEPEDNKQLYKVWAIDKNPKIIRKGLKKFVDLESLNMIKEMSIPIDDVENEINKRPNIKNIFEKFIKLIERLKDIKEHVKEWFTEHHIYMSFDPATKQLIIFYENNEGNFPVIASIKISLTGLLSLIATI